MSCDETVELLPWLLNGTLGEEKERQVRAHLETCESCREELRQTRLAWSLAEGHLPAEALVDYAMGRPLPSARRELIESHLARCSHCREELELLGVIELLGVSPETEIAQMPVHRSSAAMPRTYVVLAAVLATLIAGGGWVWTGWQLARERAAWRRQAHEPQARIEALGAPRLNTPVIDLLPSTTDAVLRSTTPKPDAYVNEVALPAGAAQVTLTLLSGGPESADVYTIEILRGRDELIWRGEGLVRNQDGHFTLTLAADLLPPGRSTIQISRRGDSEYVVRYEIRASTRSP